jgi:hypothetical protein
MKGVNLTVLVCILFPDQPSATLVIYRVNLKCAEKPLGWTSLAKIRKQIHINMGPQTLSHSPANLMTISAEILNFCGSHISPRAPTSCCRPEFHFQTRPYAVLNVSGYSTASALEPCCSCIIAYTEGGGCPIMSLRFPRGSDFSHDKRCPGRDSNLIFLNISFVEYILKGSHRAV